MNGARIFIFKSEVDAPAQFRPWRAFGSIAPDGDPPYQLPRAQMEEAINQQGLRLDEDYIEILESLRQVFFSTIS
jgi:hypothetical protein